MCFDTEAHKKSAHERQPVRRTAAVNIKMRLQHDICWASEFFFRRLLIVFCHSYCWCCRPRLLFTFCKLWLDCWCCCCCIFSHVCQYVCVWAWMELLFYHFVAVFFFVLLVIISVGVCTSLFQYVTPFLCESSIRAQSLIQFSWKCKGMHENSGRTVCRG